MDVEKLIKELTERANELVHEHCVWGTIEEWQVRYILKAIAERVKEYLEE